ncbi:MAG: T6SS amidase immunity protein Tai4 family protein [Nitrospira sp.]
MKKSLVGIATLVPLTLVQAATSPFEDPATATYSQKTLLKNWALSVCLAKVAKNAELKEDANATASAYMEFGKQPIEAYDALHDLADRYAHRKYSGAVQSEFNTMKCIDLLHSKELEALAGKWATSPR